MQAGALGAQAGGRAGSAAGLAVGHAGRAARARPGRRLGVLAGSAGPSWCTVHLA